MVCVHARVRVCVYARARVTVTEAGCMYVCVGGEAVIWCMGEGVEADMIRIIIILAPNI